MATGPRFTRKFTRAVLGLALVSLVFLGSPGCGCGDDDLGTEEQRPEKCCCTFQWLPPRAAFNGDVVLTIENMDVDLDAEATPAFFANVNFTVPVTFTVCVNAEHLLGSSLELVFSDDDTAEEYGRYNLVYKTRCDPDIEPLSDDNRLTSTNCGDDEPLDCCCLFEWLPGSNMAGDVTIAAENATAGLDPTIDPGAISGVVPGVIELINVCVALDHPLGATMDLVVRQQGSGALMGQVQLVYEERCTPTVVPASTVPTLEITSTECGGEPNLCCCEFEWLPPVDYTGNVTITAENASPGLTVEITPSTINGVVPRTFYTFTVCINADHNLLDGFELVITDTTGPEILRSQVVYRLRCEPDFGNVEGPEGQQLGSPDCGTPTQCCCDFEWFLTDPDLVLPPPPWSVALENVDSSLEAASINPTVVDFLDIPPAVVLFTVCVNSAHTLGAAMDIVVRDSSGAEFARLPMDWQPQCTPAIGDPSGAGNWINLCAEPPPAKPGR